MGNKKLIVKDIAVLDLWYCISELCVFYIRKWTRGINIFIIVAGRCIPQVPNEILKVGGEVMKDAEGEPVTGEVLAKASYFLGQFYKATEVL